MSGPHVAPTVGIFDEPGIPLCLNSEWASFADGALALLLARSYWKGTDAEIDDAVDQVEILLAKLGEIGACNVGATPIGGIMMHGSETAPDGWLACDGAAVSRATYALLFAAIGETWGPGDGTTTFNLPDFRYRSPMGVSVTPNLNIAEAAGEAAHALTQIENASHAHAVTDPGHSHTPAAPYTALFGNRPTGNAAVNNGTTYGNALTLASATTGISIQSSGNGVAHNTVHPVRGVPFIIFAGTGV